MRICVGCVSTLSRVSTYPYLYILYATVPYILYIYINTVYSIQYRVVQYSTVLYATSLLYCAYSTVLYPGKLWKLERVCPIRGSEGVSNVHK